MKAVFLSGLETMGKMIKAAFTSRESVTDETTHTYTQTHKILEVIFHGASQLPRIKQATQAKVRVIEHYMNFTVIVACHRPLVGLINKTELNQNMATKKKKC